MDQLEALEAFNDQVPVVWFNPIVSRNPILLKRISEIVYRKDADGNNRFVVGGMDQNERSIIHDDPETFQRLTRESEAAIEAG